MRNASLCGCWRSVKAGIFWSLVLSLAADARVGETLEECRERYGHFELKDAGGIKSGSVEKSGFEIRMAFQNGKCGMIVYRKRNLTPEEAKQLMEKNGKGPWEGEDGKRYKNPEGTVAMWNLRSVMREVFIATQEFQEVMEARRKKRMDDL